MYPPQSELPPALTLMSRSAKPETVQSLGVHESGSTPVFGADSRWLTPSASPACSRGWLRALFVADWDPEEPLRAFRPRDELTTIEQRVGDLPEPLADLARPGIIGPLDRAADALTRLDHGAPEERRLEHERPELLPVRFENPSCSRTLGRMRLITMPVSSRDEFTATGRVREACRVGRDRCPEEGC